MTRRAGMVAAGVVAITMSFGFAGGGVASAASPATGHIHAGSDWSLAMNGGSCEIEHFASNSTFISPDDSGSGYWSQTASTVVMRIISGPFGGLKFKGTYSARRSDFSGKFKDASRTLVGTGTLDKGTLDCQPSALALNPRRS